MTLQSVGNRGHVGFGVAVIAAALTASAGQIRAADLNNVSLTRESGLLQTSSGAPVAKADFPYDTFTAVQANGPGDLTSGTVVGPATGTLSAQTRPIPFGSPANFQFADSLAFSDDFATAASMDAALPLGTYTVTANTVHNGVYTFTLPLAAGTYPPAPHATNYDALQDIPAADVDSTVVTFDELVAPSTFTNALLKVFDSAGNVIFFSNAFDASTAGPGAIAIDPGIMQPGRSYSASLIFSTVNVVEGVHDAGQPDVIGIDGYDTFTHFSLATVPEPAMGAVMLTTTFALVLKRRPKRI